MTTRVKSAVSSAYTAPGLKARCWPPSACSPCNIGVRNQREWPHRDAGEIRVHAGMGLVSEAFGDGDLAGVTGDLAVGHTRYSTTGSSNVGNAQPLLVHGNNGPLAVAHNGNIINSVQLRTQLQDRWSCQFETTTDTEVIAHLLANATGSSWPERLFHGMRLMQGAFSLALLTPDALIAARDPLGIRPLCLGRLGVDGADGWVFASESCALDHMQAEFVRELEPGEVVVITRDGIHSEVYRSETPRERALCVFEWIYFARPDSMMDGRLMHSVREEMGAELAREHPADADLVIGIPDSSTSAAVGFAKESGIPFVNGLVRNRYVGRTFIEPEQQRRDRGVRQKFNPMPSVLRGKRLVVVDDSIVRGTTTPHVRGIAQEGRCHRNPSEGLRSADQAPLLFGSGHGHSTGADRGQLYSPRDTQVDRRRQLGLPER